MCLVWRGTVKAVAKSAIEFSRGECFVEIVLHESLVVVCDEVDAIRTIRQQSRGTRQK